MKRLETAKPIHANIEDNEAVVAPLIDREARNRHEVLEKGCK